MNRTISAALVVALYSLGWLATAKAQTCPLVYAECLDAEYSSTRVDRLADSGATSWEVQALAVIGSGVIGKHPFDVIPTPEGGAVLGIVHRHIDPGEEMLGTGYLADGDGWRDMALALLYADRAQGYRWQLDSWRTVVRPAVSAARAGGCRRMCLAVVAAIANTSPTLARRLGAEHEWDPSAMLEAYATTPHRARRAERMGVML